MREPDTVVKRWYLSEGVTLEADGDVIEVVIGVGQGNTVRGTLSDTDNAVRALREASSWNPAVYPPGGGGREFPPPMRARAWSALAAAGEDRPNEVKVTGFLRDWHSQGGLAGESIEDFAVTWRRLRYAS
jgi:hypothetical protein